MFFNGLTTEDGFVVTVALHSKNKKKKQKTKTGVQYPGGKSQASLVRITSTATSILRGRLHQADFISPTSATNWLLPFVVWCWKLVNKRPSPSPFDKKAALRQPCADPAAPTNRRICFYPAFLIAYSDTWTGNSPVARDRFRAASVLVCGALSPGGFRVHARWTEGENRNTESCDTLMWSGISLHMYVQFKSINILLGSDDDNEVFIHFSSDNSSATS